MGLIIALVVVLGLVWLTVLGLLFWLWRIARMSGGTTVIIGGAAWMLAPGDWVVLGDGVRVRITSADRYKRDDRKGCSIHQEGLTNMASDHGHKHPCRICRRPFECFGALWKNHDGMPEVVCSDYDERMLDTCQACLDLDAVEQAAQDAEDAAAALPMSWQQMAMLSAQCLAGAIAFVAGAAMVATWNWGLMPLAIGLVVGGGWIIWEVAHA